MRDNLDFDVVVIGASFAGSAFAQRAAQQGARVLLLEKNAAAGAVVHTTGVIIAEVPGSRYGMSDSAGLLRWLAQRATAAGAELQTGARFTDARPTVDGVTVCYQSDGVEQRVRGRFLVGADGPLSRVAEVSGLHRNQGFLAGAEWIVEGASPPSRTFSLIFDRTLSPGYCAWLAPRGEHAAMGVAGYAWEFHPARALRRAAEDFAALLGDAILRPVERKGGIIPIGGHAGEMHNERVVLVGDAAGLCGAATGGGIFQAIVSGRLAADAVIGYLNGDAQALPGYRGRLLRFHNLGSLLFLERQLRRLLDRLTLNGTLQWLFDRFRQPARRRLLRRGLLQTHVSEMEKLPWDLFFESLLHPLRPGELVSGALWFGLEGLASLLG
jgi:digeranylgeranylglycerophospholipid reductase